MRINFRLKQKQSAYIAGLILILIAAIFGLDLNDLKSIEKDLLYRSPSISQIVAKPPDKARVISVIDGDTIIIEGNIKVRYIGIDTPEIYKDTTGQKTGEECYARESYLHNKELVEGKIISMKKDTSNTDKYGRLLRYVYLDNLFVNEYLVKKGYAKTMTVKPDVLHSELFKIRQTEAKELSLGLWNVCPTPKPKTPR